MTIPLLASICHSMGDEDIWYQRLTESDPDDVQLRLASVKDKKTLLLQKGLVLMVELKGLEPLTSTMPL